MSHPLTPSLILEAYAANRLTDAFEAVCLFVDTSGFTPLTNALMQHGAEGAEVLAQVLVNIFTPLLETVYAHGGFVAGFAGDAIKAIFPERTPESHQCAVNAAWQIRQQMLANPRQSTRFGDFHFAVKITIASGRAEWVIWRNTEATPDIAQRAAAFFTGNALTQALAADPLAQAGDIVMTAAVAAVLQALSVTVQMTLAPVADHLRLHHWQTPTLPPAVSSTPLPIADSAVAFASHFFPVALLERQVQGEFRQVTTLFVNLQSLPSDEAAIAFTAVFFRLLAQYGGYLCRIGQFGERDHGGSLLCFWGAPTSHENDVLRALHFALTLQAVAATPLRIGITTALAYAGFVGSSLCEEYTCYGAHVNLAARQMMMASWGEIWLDEESTRLGGDTFETIYHGQLRFKGFAEERAVYRLLRLREFTIADFYQGVMVGRQAELTQLATALAPLAAGRFAGVITIIGEAGMGKSRLVHELQKQGEESRKQKVGSQQPPSLFPTSFSLLSPQWFLCQTDEILRQPLNPLRYWLHSYFNQSSSADEGSNKVAFMRQLEDLALALTGRAADANLKAKIENLKAEITRTHSFLGALVDLRWPDSLYEQLEPRLRFENTLNALKSLLLAESLRQPVILHLEDAHWLDADSRTFLVQLTRNVSEYPLALIITSRPPAETGQAETTLLIPTEAPQSTLTLTGLGESDLTALATALLAGPPAPALRALVNQRAEGNPFFAEQLLLYLQEEELLEQGPAGWQVRADLTTATLVPDEARTLLVARLDRLAQGVKETVQTAAVLGREFAVDLLSRMLHEQSVLPTHLQNAEAAAIWSALSRLRYLFKHAMLRDAAYDMQLRARLRALHSLAATSIQQLYGADLTPHYASLAYHSEQAEAWTEARHWYQLAGEQAATQYANQSALFYFTRAFALTPPDEVTTQYQILLAREQVYGLLGQRTAQRQDLDALQALALRLADAKYEAQVMVQQIDFALNTGDYATTITLAPTAIALAEKGEDRQSAGRSYYLWGHALRRMGDYPAAQAQLEQAHRLAVATNDLRLAAQALGGLGTVACEENAYSRAREYQEQAHQIVRQLGDRRLESALLSNIGVVFYNQGRYDESRPFIEAALHIDRAIGDRRGEGIDLQALANNRCQQGDWEQAIHYNTVSLAIARETNNLASQAYIFSSLGYVSCFQEKHMEAVAYFTQAQSIFHTTNQRMDEGWVLNDLGAVMLALGAYDAAQTHFAQALHLSQATAHRHCEGIARFNLGLFSYMQGEDESALTYFQQAVEIAQMTESLSHEMSALAYQCLIWQRLDRWERGAALYQQLLECKQRWQRNSASHATEFTYFLQTITVLAHLAIEQKQPDVAQGYIEELFQHLNQRSLDLRDNPQYIYLTGYRVLRVLDDPRAGELLRAGYQRLQRQAANIPDEALRRSFLENVVEHRTLLAEYQEMATLIG